VSAGTHHPGADVGEVIAVAMQHVLPDKAVPQTYKTGIPTIIVLFGAGYSWVVLDDIEAKESDAMPVTCSQNSRHRRLGSGPSTRMRSRPPIVTRRPNTSYQRSCPPLLRPCHSTRSSSPRFMSS